MKPSDYVFLETREARMLAAAYLNIDRAALKPEQFARAAARQAGIDTVPGFNVERCWFSLIAVGIIRAEDLDPDAAAFIKQAAYAAAGIETTRAATNPMDEIGPVASSLILTFPCACGAIAGAVQNRHLDMTEIELFCWRCGKGVRASTMGDALGAWRDFDRRATKHPGEVGPSIPHAPFDPTGHAAGCNAFACVSHCKQPRKASSPEAGC